MGFLSTLAGLGQRHAASAEPAHPGLARIASILGDSIESATDYRRRVVPALERACAHFATQVDAIPGPIELSAAAHHHHTFLEAMFPAVGDIQAALGRSIDIKESLPALSVGEHTQAFALLGLRCRPGDQSPGRPRVFADHTLKCPSLGEAETRQALRDAALERLLRRFDEHLGKLREKRRLLAVEWNIGNLPGDLPGPIGGYRTLEQETQPDNLLHGLLCWLDRPAEHLQVSASEVRIDGRSPDTHQRATLELPVLKAADRRQWNVCLVRFPIREGLHALGHETHHHRYIFI